MPDQYSYLIGKRYGEENLGTGRPKTDVKSQTDETGGQKSDQSDPFNSGDDIFLACIIGTKMQVK